jgi:hypothetical protein
LRSNEEPFYVDNIHQTPLLRRAQKMADRSTESWFAGAKHEYSNDNSNRDWM